MFIQINDVYINTNQIVSIKEQITEITFEGSDDIFNISVAPFILTLSNGETIEISDEQKKIIFDASN